MLVPFIPATSVKEAQEHLKPVGTLQTNYPTLNSQAEEAMHGKVREPARKALPAPIVSNRQTLPEVMTIAQVYEQ